MKYRAPVDSERLNFHLLEFGAIVLCLELEDVPSRIRYVSLNIEDHLFLSVILFEKSELDIMINSTSLMFFVL